MPLGYACLPELIAVSRGEAIEPGLRLFGLANGLRARLAAGGEELLLEFERLQAELRPRLVDGVTDLAQLVDDRRDGCACPPISLMVEQAPFPRSCNPQRLDQFGGIFRFELEAARVQAGETVRFGQGLIPRS
jgi:hypothetical protein